MEKKKILVCDDEIDTHLFIEAALEKYNFEIVEAWSGKQAIEIVKSNKPDLIIMDYNMPGMDGFETLTEIQKISPNIPAVMLTGVNIEPGTKQNLKAYIVAYLVKPFEHSELTAVLGKIFEDLEV
jgi:CheY-like chemotaxis protein